MKIVCIGDSITYGYGVKEKQTWIELVKKSTGINMLNHGINGDSTGGMLYRFKRDVLEHEPTHVIIMGGSNDLIMEISLSAICSNIASMIKLSIENNIKPIIGLQPPADPTMANIYWSAYTDFKKFNNDLKAYREWVINASKEYSIEYIDFYKMIEDSLINSPKEEIYIDGVHPTSRGHELMAKQCLIVYEALHK